MANLDIFDSEILAREQQNIQQRNEYPAGSNLADSDEWIKRDAEERERMIADEVQQRLAEQQSTSTDAVDNVGVMDNSPIKQSEPTLLTAWKMSSSNDFEPSLTDISDEMGGIFAPKLKFLFTLSIVPSVSFKNLINSLGSDKMSDYQYQLLNVTRPNIKYNMVDINRYNYRSKVATFMDVGELTVNFYDDNKNTAHTLLTNYLGTMSPVLNLDINNFSLINEFDKSSVGALGNNDAEGLLNMIRIAHHYRKQYTDNNDNMTAIYYDYINPKITSINFDELNMSLSESSMISATFTYDSVFIHGMENNGISLSPITTVNVPPIFDITVPDNESFLSLPSRNNLPNINIDIPENGAFLSLPNSQNTDDNIGNNVDVSMSGIIRDVINNSSSPITGQVKK